jgi:hypothetical protein
MKRSPFSTFSISDQTFIVVAQVISLQREMLSHPVPIAGSAVTASQSKVITVSSHSYHHSSSSSSLLLM